MGKGAHKSRTSAAVDARKKAFPPPRTERLRGLGPEGHGGRETPLPKHLRPLLTLTPGPVQFSRAGRG